MANPFQLFSIGAIIGILSSIFLGKRKKNTPNPRDNYTPTPSGRDSVLVDNPPANDTYDNNRNNDRIDDVRDGSG